jgi:4-hydroxy-3-polyprenylbenzoate decarboxylase
VVYGVRLLEACQELGIETDLMVSPAAEQILKFELNKKLEDLQKLATRSHKHDDLAAPISSGSVPTDGMIIAPCSMKTLGALASGVTADLTSRAADVTLKQGRRLVLVPRETPLNLIHIENMAKLERAGAVILPAMPAFYHKPNNVKGLVDFIVGKILDIFDIEHELYQRWRGY